MKDIVPELYENILNDFKKNCVSDTYIQKFIKKLEAGTATQADIAEYSKRLSKAASKALLKNISSDKLPDGRLYWNIANRTIKPLLKTVHEMIVDAAAEIISVENRKNNIGIIPVKPQFSEERADAFINKLINVSLQLSQEVENERE